MGCDHKLDCQNSFSLNLVHRSSHDLGTISVTYKCDIFDNKYMAYYFLVKHTFML